MKDILYSPYLPEYKTPVGALDVDRECRIRLLIKKSYRIVNLQMVVYRDNRDNLIIRPVSEENGEYHAFLFYLLLKEADFYRYYFEFDDCFGHHFIGADDDLDALLCDRDVVSFQLSVVDKRSEKPDWFSGKTVYQIFPDRFHRSGETPFKQGCYRHLSWDEDVCDYPIEGLYANDFYGGNLKGITVKLPYLKALGIGVIYLNPIFLSPSNHRYNTADYLRIDPLLGTEDDFRELVNEAGKLGIAVVLDGVFNHTGADSVYFNRYEHFPDPGACQGPVSPYYDWFCFNAFPDDYRCWWGIKDLPAVNQKSGFVDFITEDKTGVIAKWMGFGIRGFRLDVVDELDSEFLRKITSAIKHNDPEAIVIGEVWEDASNKISYGKRRTYFIRNELDSVTDYPLRNAIISYLKGGGAVVLRRALRHRINNYPPYVTDRLLNILSTHDTARIITEFSETGRSRELVKMAYSLLYTLPGVPSLFYGDEWGSEGGKDPFCRRPMRKRENCFTGDDDIFRLLIKLGKLRENPVFKGGMFREEFGEGEIYAFSRIGEKERILVIANNTSKYYIFSDNPKKVLTENALSGEKITGEIGAEAYSVGIFKIFQEN